MPPAPIASTVRTAASGDVSPSAAIMDEPLEYIPIIPAVVVIATVEEPCAVLRMAAMMNGNSIPIDDIADAWLLINSTKPAEVMTPPSTPPAAVIKRIGPAVFKESSVIVLN